MPTRTSLQQDPRSIITPDAFEVSKDLLGLPLAKPARRLVALLIDLAVIGVITAVTKNFALVLGVLMAFFFVREGFKRTAVRGSVFGRAMRFSVGCLGLVIGLVTAVIWMAVGISGGLGDTPIRVETTDADGTPRRATFGTLMELAHGLDDARRLAEAPDQERAQDAANDLARRAVGAGMNAEQIRDVLVEAIPDDADWSDETEAIVDRAIAEAQGDTALIRGLAAAADSVAADPATAVLADTLVADTLAALQRRILDLATTSDARGNTIDELRSELRREREGGTIFSWLRDFVDELGFGFGWASLYLTVMLSWWNGQTVGKRMMKVRVLRLDGEPITWWTAFERAGGYAAGFATGLLGFAQVYWDANRQAIHDRIVGTVVVMDGAKKVVGWEEAL